MPKQDRPAGSPSKKHVYDAFGYEPGAGPFLRTLEYLRDIALAFTGERRRLLVKYEAMQRDLYNRANYTENIKADLNSADRHRQRLIAQVARLEQSSHETHQEYEAAKRQVDVHAKVIAQQLREREKLAAEMLAFKAMTYETIKLAAACFDIGDPHQDVRLRLDYLVDKLKPTMEKRSG